MCIRDRYDGWKEIDRRYRAALKNKPETDDADSDIENTLPQFTEGQTFENPAATVTEQDVYKRQPLRKPPERQRPACTLRNRKSPYPAANPTITRYPAPRRKRVFLFTIKSTASRKTIPV